MTLSRMLLLLGTLSPLSSLPVLAADPVVERLTLPGWEGSPVTAVDWTPSNELVVAGAAGVIRGQADPAGGRTWQTFWADGLDTPGAVLVQDEKAALLLQGAELTRLLDTDKDGKGDLSDVVFSSWGLNVAPADLGTAPRALFRPDGATLLSFASGAGHWTQRFPLALPPKDERLSWTPRWAGCLVLLSKDTKNAEVVAVGFHRVTALAAGPEGQVFVLDTLSPWGAPAIYQLHARGYYGNPESFPQLPPAPPEPKKKGKPSRPTKKEPDVVKAQFPVALLPPSVCARPMSLAWMKLPDSGPAGDLIVGDGEGGRCARVRLSGPGDRLQGCASGWLSSSALSPGLLALAPAPDGASLLAGLKDGAALVRPTEPADFQLSLLQVRDGWLECQFTRPLAPEVLAKAAELPFALWPLDSVKGPGPLQVVQPERHIIEPEGYGISWKLPESLPLQGLVAVDFTTVQSASGDHLPVTQFFIPAQLEPTTETPETSAVKGNGE